MAVLWLHSKVVIDLCCTLRLRPVWLPEFDFRECPSETKTNNLIDWASAFNVRCEAAFTRHRDCFHRALCLRETRFCLFFSSAFEIFATSDKDLLTRQPGAMNERTLCHVKHPHHGVCCRVLFSVCAVSGVFHQGVCADTEIFLSVPGYCDITACGNVMPSQGRLTLC